MLNETGQVKTMSKKTEKIESTDAAWDDRQLGADEKYVGVSDLEPEDIISKATNSRAISIRIRETLIDDLKFIAKQNEIGYQTLIKQVLQRFVEAEMRKAWNKMVAESDVNTKKGTKNKNGCHKSERNKAA